MKKPEVLAPAGNPHKAKAALAYGADALYLAGKHYGMRAAAGNFADDELVGILQLAHDREAKVYVTVNIFAHNQHLSGLPEYLGYLESLGVDAIIVADPGVFRMAGKYAPKTPVHISTQANTTNVEAVKFWQDQGAQRVVLARELARQDIAAIMKSVDIEVEMFVHGAMCMAYSGRCMLSKTLTGRDANLGACAQSCRWEYAVMESSRPGEYFPVEEAAEGTYLFNSKDLCLINHIPELMDMGVHSLKIEGRMKSAYYTAAVTRAYRMAVDRVAEGNWNQPGQEDLLAELRKVSHRPYYEGFYLEENPGTHLSSTSYEHTYDFVGLVEAYDTQRQAALVDVRNRLEVGESVEVMQPRGPVIAAEIAAMEHSQSGEALNEAHANTKVWMPLAAIQPYAILRRRKSTAGA